MNAYTILGVQPTDTTEDIKKAYRKLANKHHPDKEGGDATQFKKIQKAYEDIKSGAAKTNHYNFRTGNDLYNFFQNQNVQPNRIINIEAKITIPIAINGGMQILEITMVPGQKPQYINIEIPKGLLNGEVILYPKILIHKIDVRVKFVIIPDKIWSIDGYNITKIEEFDFWDLIVGTTREIETVTKEKIKLIIPPLTKPESKLKLSKKGIHSRQNHLQIGDMYVKIRSILPDIITNEIVSLIKDIKR